MIPEIEIWRSAQEMIRQHGDDGSCEAKARANELTEQGDATGGALWRRISEAIWQLQDQMPDSTIY